MMPSSGSGYVEQAYRVIRQRILDNVYPAGYRALEREFAAELELSRTPVREALLNPHLTQSPPDSMRT